MDVESPRRTFLGRSATTVAMVGGLVAGYGACAVVAGAARPGERLRDPALRRRLVGGAEVRHGGLR